MSKLLTLLIISFSILNLNAQSNFWSLSDSIEWEFKYSRAHGAKVAFPIFPQELKTLHNKVVTIEGYLIPTKTSEGILLLSHTSNRNCLHCAGGTAHIIGVSVNDDIKVSLNEKLVFRGKLRLNDTQDGLIYYLKEAVLINKKKEVFQAVGYD